MLEAITHPHSRLPGTAKAERTLDVIALAAGHLRREFVLPLEFLHVQVSQFRLGVEGVDVARTAFHEQADAGLGLRLMMRRPGSQRTCRGPGILSPQQRMKCRRAE